MTHRSGLGLALALAVALSACASTERDGLSRPGDNRYTRDAEQNIAMAMLQPEEAEQRRHYQLAYDAAAEGLERYPDHAKLWLQYGQANVGLGDYEAADEAFIRALELYPPYADEIEVDRENAWIEAYNVGAQALQADDTEAAIRAFQQADVIYRNRPDARVVLGWLYTTVTETEQAIESYRGALEIIRGPRPEWMTEEHDAEWREHEETAALNLADLLARAGRAEEAAAVYGDFLERYPDHVDATVQYGILLSGEGRDAEASEIYGRLLSEELDEAQVFMVGVGLFQAQRYDEAADAFRRTLALNPFSRDAHYNLAQALWVRADEIEDGLEAAEAAEAARLSRELGEIYDQIKTHTEAVLELDPANRNVLLILARAYRGLADTAADEASATQWRTRTMNLLEKHEAMPFEVVDVQVSVQPERVILAGSVVNLTVPAGEPIQMRVSAIGEDGRAVAAEMVELTAPAPEASVPFRMELRVDQTVKGWKYEVIL